MTFHNQIIIIADRLLLLAWTVPPSALTITPKLVAVREPVAPASIKALNECSPFSRVSLTKRRAHYIHHICNVPLGNRVSIRWGLVSVPSHLRNTHHCSRSIWSPITHQMVFISVYMYVDPWCMLFFLIGKICSSFKKQERSHSRSRDLHSGKSHWGNNQNTGTFHRKWTDTPRYHLRSCCIPAMLLNPVPSKVQAWDGELRRRSLLLSRW